MNQHSHRLNQLTKDQIESLSQAEQRAIESCPYNGYTGEKWKEGFVEGYMYAMDAFLFLSQLALYKTNYDKDALKNLIPRIEELKGGRP